MNLQSISRLKHEWGPSLRRVAGIAGQLHRQIVHIAENMSAIPELKQKKNERDALLAKEEAAEAAAAEIKSAEMIHTITERAKAYEEEYREVCHLF